MKLMEMEVNKKVEEEVVVVGELKVKVLGVMESCLLYMDLKKEVMKGNNMKKDFVLVVVVVEVGVILKENRENL